MYGVVFVSVRVTLRASVQLGGLRNSTAGQWKFAVRGDDAAFETANVQNGYLLLHYCTRVLSSTTFQQRLIAGLGPDHFDQRHLEQWTIQPQL